MGTTTILEDPKLKLNSVFLRPRLGGAPVVIILPTVLWGAISPRNISLQLTEVYRASE
jgi:hypothetical protein